MTNTPIGIAVLVAFSLSFCAICLWAFWPSNRQRMKAWGLIPLQEEDDNV